MRIGTDLDEGKMRPIDARGEHALPACERLGEQPCRRHLARKRAMKKKPLGSPYDVESSDSLDDAVALPFPIVWRKGGKPLTNDRPQLRLRRGDRGGHCNGRATVSPMSFRE